jgi:hypothetical protein
VLLAVSARLGYLIVSFAFQSWPPLAMAQLWIVRRQEHMSTTHKSQRRWFAIGGLFAPYQLPAADGKPAAGCQTIAIMDVESQYFMEHWSAPRPPAAFSAAEIIAFVDRVFAKHGKPKIGLLISPSAWRSTHALFDDVATRERVAGVWEFGMTWPEMDAGERSKISSHLQALGLSLAWDEDDIPNKDELIWL